MTAVHDPSLKQNVNLCLCIKLVLVIYILPAKTRSCRVTGKVLCRNRSLTLTRSAPSKWSYVVDWLNWADMQLGGKAAPFEVENYVCFESCSSPIFQQNHRTHRELYTHKDGMDDHNPRVAIPHAEDLSFGVAVTCHCGVFPASFLVNRKQKLHSICGKCVGRWQDSHSS